MIGGNCLNLHANLTIRKTPLCSSTRFVVKIIFMSQALPARILALLLCFFSLSLVAQNPNGDNRRCQEDARISLAFSGDTIRGTCTDDDVMDRLRFQVQPFRQAFAYVVVDASDVIQLVGFSNFINFDMLPAGQLKVYAFSTFGDIAVEVGDTFTGATLAEPCAGLTSNFVTINNGATGDVTIASAQDSYEVCAGDGNADNITVTSDATDVVYVITDGDGLVLGLNDDGVIDFEDAGPGNCRVYALAGGLSIEPGENVSTLEGVGTCGAGLSNNFITVIRTAIAGGVITTAAGEVTVEVCPGDGIADLVDFVLDGAEGENTAVLITDESNVIVMVPASSTVNFDPTPPGICRAWGVAYSGDLNAMVGQQVNDLLAATECISLSANFVQVTRTVPEGGTVATTAGETDVQTCPGDGVDDIIDVVTTGTAGDLVYILTGDDNLILDFSNTPSFNLEGAPVGTCRIWSATYRGSLTFSPGEDITAAAISDNCFALSDNFVTVVRAVPAGGTVATEAGETEITTCPGDGADDFVTFVSTGAGASNFTYVVTDAEGNILGVPPADSVNFEGAGTGACRLYGLAYEGDLLAAMGGSIDGQLATECFSLSDNFVTVIRELPSGGTVSLDNGATQVTICPGDGIADVLSFTSDGATGELFNFIITDDTGEILGFPASASVDFETIPAGICRVYGLSYSGSIVANVGDDINDVQLATSCASLSDNFVTVSRIEASTGPVSLEDGSTEALVCPGDAFPDILRFDSTGTTLSNFNYLVTDTNNIILQVPFTDAINFESFAPGVCRVWGFGYDGVVIATIGQTAGVDQLATQCSALSDNFVTVVKQVPDGGTIATDEGENEVMVCSMDGIPDLVTAVSSSASGARFFYVLTTEDNVVITIQDDATFDFDVAPFGVCRIWGLSFQGTLLLETDDNIDEVMLADGCADLSDNFITVIREDAAVGNISLADGGDVTNTCPGDGMPDIVNFTVDGPSSDIIYLVTNEQDTLLASFGDGAFDFDGAGEGICRVYALSFAGDLLAAPGTEVTTADLSTGCFALSDNYVTVIREAPGGGSVSLADGTNEVSFCSGDGEPDVLNFITTSTFGSYGYVVSDGGIALTGIMTDSFDFSNTLTGTYEVYGIAYTGELTVAPGFNIFDSNLSTDCFELSDNFITVNVTMVDGGEILGNEAEEVFFCPENLTDGFVTFESSSFMLNGDYVYVITTANEAQVVLSVMDSSSFDFGALPLMEVKVFGISYTGDLLVMPGTSLAFGDIATGCVSVSRNCVTIFNDSPEAGEVSVDGLSSSGISCIVDGNTDISISTTSTSLTGYAVLVTDQNGIVQLVSTTPEAVPFGTLPEGDYRLYGLAYTGNVTAVIGDDIAVAVLADNCYELTTEFVEITRGGEITAGSLLNATTEEGGDTITFCFAAGDVPIAIIESTVGTPNYRYIVTNADDEVLVANLPSSIIPFTAFGAGEYRIYGFNFTGTPSVGIGQTLTTSILSNECYALSANFITVILSDPDAGMVTTDMGASETTIEIDASSGAPVALATFATTAPGPDAFVYLITDEDNLILGASPDATIDFGPAGVGVCRVWGLAYTGELTAVMGEDAAVAQLADGCFALSDGFVTVTRTDDDGLAGGDTGVDGGLSGEGLAGDDSGSTTSLSAFPNPSASGEIFITLTSNLLLDGGQLSVRDLNGQTHQVQTVAGGTADTTIRFDVSDLAPGMYFVTYVTAQGIESLQFMKQ